MSIENPKEIMALTASIEDLREGLERHCGLVSSMLGMKTDLLSQNGNSGTCPSRLRELTLVNAVKDAIDTLEESRKAFKSKQLENLRKRLVQALVDTR